MKIANAYWLKISFQDDSHLREVGQGLVKKCKGLPLAAKVLGGILLSKYSESEWKDVLDSKILGLPQENILPVLRLSYHHLPSHLRNPFAYCSVLPKDYDYHACNSPNPIDYHLQERLHDLWGTSAL